MTLEWISSNNAMPADMESVLLSDELEGEFIGYYYAPKNIFIRDLDGKTISNVTHWMKLPPKPKKNKGELEIA